MSDWVKSILIILVLTGANFSVILLANRSSQIISTITGFGKGLSKNLRGIGINATKNRAARAVQGTSNLGKRSLLPRGIPVLGNIRNAQGRSVNDFLKKLNDKTTGFWVSPLRRAANWNKGGISGSLGALGVGATAVLGRIGLGGIPGVEALRKRGQKERVKYQRAVAGTIGKSAQEAAKADAGRTGGDEAAGIAAISSGTRDEFIDRYMDEVLRDDEAYNSPDLESDDETKRAGAVERADAAKQAAYERAEEAAGEFEDAHGVKFGTEAAQLAGWHELAGNKTNFQNETIKDGPEKGQLKIGREATREMRERLWRTLIPKIAAGKLTKAQAVNVLRSLGERPDQSKTSWGYLMKFIDRAVKNYNGGGVIDNETGERVLITTEMSDDYSRDVLHSARSGEIAGGDYRSHAALLPAIEDSIQSVKERAAAEGIDANVLHAQMYGRLAGMIDPRSNLSEKERLYLRKILNTTDKMTGRKVIDELSEYDKKTPSDYLTEYKTWVRDKESEDERAAANMPRSEIPGQGTFGFGGGGGTI